MSVYNVMSYGATGNGSTDDTSAINSAIAACGGGTSAGVVYFPAGTYKITSTLNVSSKNGCILRGDGPGASYLMNSNRSSNAITFSNCQASGVEELNIYSDRSGGNPTSGYAVQFSGCYNCRVRRAYIGYCYNGIYNASSSETVLTQVLIRGAYGLYAVYYAGSASQACYGMAVEDLITDPIDTGNTNCTGFAMDSYAYSLSIRRAALLGGGVGFAMSDSAGGGASSRPAWAEVFDLELDHNNTVGMWLSGGTGFYMVDGWIGSCLTGNGVIIGSSFGGEVSISNSRIVENQQYGILSYAGPIDLIVTGCFINSNSQGGSAAFNDVTIASNAQSFILNGNRVGTEVGSTNPQGYGIFVYGGCKNYIITNNLTYGNIYGGIYNGGGTANVIANNV